MSPSAGAPRTCLPTSWPGPKPSIKSASWPPSPARRREGDHLRKTGSWVGVHVATSSLGKLRWKITVFPNLHSTIYIIKYRLEAMVKSVWVSRADTEMYIERDRETGPNRLDYLCKILVSSVYKTVLSRRCCYTCRGGAKGKHYLVSFLSL